MSRIYRTEDATPLQLTWGGVYDIVLSSFHYQFAKRPKVRSRNSESSGNGGKCALEDICHRRPGTIFRVLIGLAIAAPLGITAYSGEPTTEQLRAARHEQVHSKIFSGDEVGTIADHLAKTTGDITIVSGADHGGLRMRAINAPSYPPQRLVTLACQADIVVLAIPVHGVSHMTADQSFNYTNWAFRVREVLQDTSKAPIEGRDTIAVISPGGNLVIDGRTVHGEAYNFPEFQPGGEYLLFLTYIPETGAFTARTERTFDLAFDPRTIDPSHQY